MLFALLHWIQVLNLYYQEYPNQIWLARCCLTLSWIGLKILLMCCLLQISIIMLRYILYWVYVCLSVGLFMSYICNLFYFYSLIFIVINHKISLKQTHLFFAQFLEDFPLFLARGWKKRIIFKFAIFFANFSLALLVKVLLI